jgi:hypothetical protein
MDGLCRPLLRQRCSYCEVIKSQQPLSTMQACCSLCRRHTPLDCMLAAASVTAFTIEIGGHGIELVLVGNSFALQRLAGALLERAEFPLHPASPCHTHPPTTPSEEM